MRCWCIAVAAVERSGSTIAVRTRGDANDAEDPWTAELNNPPVWQVAKVIPHAGTMVDLLRNRLLRLVLFPLALMGLGIAILATIAQLPSVAEQIRDESAAAKPSPRPSTSVFEVPEPAAVASMTTVTAAVLQANRSVSLRDALVSAGAASAGVASDAPPAFVASAVPVYSSEAAPGELWVARRGSGPLPIGIAIPPVGTSTGISTGRAGPSMLPPTASDASIEGAEADVSLR